MAKSRSYTKRTLQILVGFSGNQCAAPSCINPVIAPATEKADEAIIGQIATSTRYWILRRERFRSARRNLREGHRLLAVAIEAGAASNFSVAASSRVRLVLPSKRKTSISRSTEHCTRTVRSSLLKSAPWHQCPV